MSSVGRLLLVTRRGYAGTFQWTDWQYWIANMALRPVLFLAVFGLIHEEIGVGATSDLVIAVCAYNVAASLLMGINHSIRNDVVEGTFAMALATPIRPTTIWLTRALAHVPNAAATGVISLCFGVLAFDLELSRLDVTSGAAFAAVIASATATAMLAGVLTARTQDWTGVVGLSSGLVLTLSGVVIPRSDLPGPLQTFSSVIPLAHANDALRDSINGAKAASWGAVGLELAVAVTMSTIALAAFNRWLRHARRTGSLVVEAR